MKEFIAKGFRLWGATLGPADVIFSPAGYVGTHKVMGASNLLGIRIGTVTPSDESILKDIKESHDKAGRASPVIAQALEYLNRAS